MNLVTKQKMIYRKDLKDNPNTIYLFGDNIKRVGLAGQAREMRGEANALGIPTKRVGDMQESSFFNDNDFEEFKNIVDSSFLHAFVHVYNGGQIVIPKDGLGTGLSELPSRAPKCYEYLEIKLRKLEKLGEE
jgi:hypothetical protein